MSGKVTTQTLFEFHRHKLSLKWIAGHGGKDRVLKREETALARASLVGHLNAIHPNQVQVLGKWEFKYLKSLGKNSYHDVIQQIFANLPAAVVIADDLTADEQFIAKAEKNNTPLMYSPVDSQKVVNRLHYFLEYRLAESSILHGVFMEVHGLGVLLTGKSGIGKSELALELINRGHRLIADDAPEFSRIGPDTVRGHCPPILRGFLEVRGLGIINVQKMFGDSAIKPSKNLRLIVKLTSFEDEKVNELDRLAGSYDSHQILDVEIQAVFIPVAPGRNLAVLVEAATRQYIQLQSGYNASLDFMHKQKQLMESDTQ
ncbi:MAG: HPr(Ser) kinase/phosphatase [Gammaproteobacteria bacterium]|jgi:HPr kinase/phosphorylase